MSIPTFNGKNMPFRGFIRNVLSEQSSVPQIAKEYIMTVLERLKCTSRNSTYGKSFSTITDLIQHLKHRFVSKFYDRITLLKPELKQH